MVLNRVVLVGLLFGAAGLGACTSVRHVQPAAYLEDNSPPVVWVTYVNNTVYHGRPARVQAGHSTGNAAGGARQHSPG